MILDHNTKSEDTESRSDCTSFELASGASVPKVARELNLSEVTYHRWRNRYDGMNPSETKRLKELEKENARLKRLVTHQALDIQILKEASRNNF